MSKFTNKQQKFSIRKMSVGTASLLIGTLFFVAHDADAATETTTPSKETTTESASNQPRTNDTNQSTSNSTSPDTSTKQSSTDKPDSSTIALKSTNDAPVMALAANNIPVISTTALNNYKVGDTFNPLTGMSATDAEDGDLTANIQVISNNVDTSKAGTYQVVYQVTDSNGNIAKATRNILVSDKTPQSIPKITNTASNTYTVGDAFNPLTGVTATDAEDGDLTPKIQIVSNNVDLTTPGTYQIVYQVTDTTNQTFRLTRTITVQPKPVANDIPKIVSNDTNNYTVGQTFDPLKGIVATDTEDGTITSKVVVASNNVDTTKAGTYQVVYEVTDSKGQTARLVRTVSVAVPNNAPKITSSASNNYFVNDNFNPMDGVNAMDPEEGDISSKITIVSNNVDTSKAGTYQVIYRVVDAQGNTGNFTRNILVSERNTMPKITSSGSNNLTVGDTFNPLTGIKATDTEDGDITSKVVVVSNNVDTTKPGTYQVVYKVTDSKGSAFTLTRNVLVSAVQVPPAPNTAPKITSSGSNNLTVGDTFNPLTGIKATDTEDGDITSKVVVVSNNVDTTKPGTYQVVYKVTDSKGSAFTLTRNVLVSAVQVPPAPNTAPKITSSGSNNLTVGDAFNPLTGIKATDTEDGDITSKVVVVSNNVDTTKPGTYQVVYKVTDSKGSAFTLTRNVLVSAVQVPPAPNTAPKITSSASNNLTVGDTFNPLTGIKATDTEDGDITSKVVVVSNNVDTTKPGTYQVVYKVTDSKGSAFTLTRNVLVSAVQVPPAPNTAPKITSSASNNLTVGDTFNPLTGIKATDTEDGDITSKVIVVSNNVDTTKPGTYQVVYKVTDSKGSAFTLTRNVLVSVVQVPPAPNTAPKITSSASNNLTVGDAFNPLTGIKATDTEDGDITSKVVVVSNNVDTTKPGTYQVVYKVTDSKGSAFTLTRNVLVSAVQVPPAPNTAPKITSSASNNLTVGDTFNPLTGIKATDTEDGDITSKVIVVSNNVDTTKPGTYQVVYKVTDSKGSVFTLTRNVLVSAVQVPPAPNTAPKITSSGSNNLTVGDAFNPLTGIKATDTEDGDITSKVVVVSNNVDTTKPGTYQVVYKVTDSKGSAFTLTRNVLVSAVQVPPAPNTAPKIISSASNNLTVGDAFNPLTGIKATDTEDGDITSKVVVVSNNVDTTKPGTYQVVYKVTDSKGNVFTLTRTVTVNKSQVPPVTKPPVNEEHKNSVPEIKVVAPNEIKVGEKFNPLDGVIVSDKEDGNITSNVEVIFNNVDTTKPGSYEVKYKVTDSNGGTFTLERTVIVNAVNNNQNNVTSKLGTSNNEDRGKQNLMQDKNDVHNMNSSSQKQVDQKTKGESAKNDTAKALLPETGEQNGLLPVASALLSLGFVSLFVSRRKK
ncbi:immunoglobulin-like domain-containing protein [Macrococcus armenti]|uniref:immunoglobulin-like domain-containing protein n=1 Tax=Macrococcus armenti TaxID=2875764 RepID=UPI001CCA876D|nr:immunoglobulin-like domain-containing protein [Macrococcus armenti]UBH09419.1 DUF5011 domain-containing protein [Macrococcus armenti]